MFIGAAIVKLGKESEWYTTLGQQHRENKTAFFFFIKAEMRKKQDKYAACLTSLCQATPGLHEHANKQYLKNTVLYFCAKKMLRGKKKKFWSARCTFIL